MSMTLRMAKARDLLKHHLAALMASHGDMKQKDLAVALDKSEAWISELINDDGKGTTLSTIDDLAEHFGVPVGHFFGATSAVTGGEVKPAPRKGAPHDPRSAQARVLQELDVRRAVQKAAARQVAQAIRKLNATVLTLRTGEASGRNVPSVVQNQKKVTVHRRRPG